MCGKQSQLTAAHRSFRYPSSSRSQILRRSSKSRPLFRRHTKRDRPSSRATVAPFRLSRPSRRLFVTEIPKDRTIPLMQTVILSTQTPLRLPALWILTAIRFFHAVRFIPVFTVERQSAFMLSTPTVTRASHAVLTTCRKSATENLSAVRRAQSRILQPIPMMTF